LYVSVYAFGALCVLHSFPTRRSSDLCVFDTQRGGYDPAEVDAALERLEVAFVAKERQEFTARGGPQVWMAQISERAQTLYPRLQDRKSTRLNSSHVKISYAVFCLKKK